MVGEQKKTEHVFIDWRNLIVLTLIVLVVLFVADIARFSGCSPAIIPSYPGVTVQVRRDTIYKRDTVYIPIPRHRTIKSVVVRNDTVFVHDTTERRDTITIAYPIGGDSALVDIRYAPEKMILDTVWIYRDSIVYYGTPWYEKVVYFSAGTVATLLLFLLAR